MTERLKWRLGLIAGLLAIAGWAGAAAAAPIGTVKRVVGKAEVERNKVRSAAQVGMPLAAGDALVTGPDGRIAVTFADESRFSVGPKSRIALNSFDFNSTTHKGRFASTVVKGQLAVVSGQIAHEDPRGMTVQSGTSVLGVRGTRFIVEVR